ncbi:histidine phosphatase family protein [Thalassoroseus pseudoceratinae]|uniref:histidine phosphatase family protein n=1 Tax=Thalassoroseus pseudoceratinae TaxID=2713176 RepID=UPI00141E1C09|nr:histidine phosphatase family protein [Thalassoroseus pseudoceratinae]
MLPPVESDTTYLLLIRHGATTANEMRPYTLQGRSVDLDLSPTGQAQAVAVGEFLKSAPLSHVYASPLKRAQQTAGQIALHHDLNVQTLETIAEVDVGQWEGKHWDGIMAEFPDDYRKFMDDPGDTPYLGGESYRDVLNRTEPAMAKLLEQHKGEAIVVVAHNVVNRAWLAHLLGLEFRLAKTLDQQNTCVNVIRHKDGETKLLTMNSHFHVPQ